jgi:hypothetical protein
MLKILYVGQLWEGGTCMERARVLGAHGWELLPLDVTPYLTRRSRIVQAAQDRALFGPEVYKLNRDLLAAAHSASAVDVVWIDKGRWVFPRTLEGIKSRTGACLVHYTPDPAFAAHTSRHFDRSVPLYDLLVTTKRYEVPRYREAGARQVLFTWQGIDDRFVRNGLCGAIDGPHRSGVVFIGHAEKHYGNVLAAVGQRHPGLKIWGYGWERFVRKRPDLRACVRGGPLWGDDYAAGLAGGRVGLGLLSKYCPDQFTTRSFEIPAAGSLLIGERTAEHEQLFEEGNEAEFFSTIDELIDKIGFYLRSETARRRVAQQGRRRALECYHWRQVLDPVLKAVNELSLVSRR